MVAALLVWSGESTEVLIPRNGVFFVLHGLTALPGWWGHGLHRASCSLKSQQDLEAHRKLPQVSYGTTLFLWYVCHTSIEQSYIWCPAHVGSNHSPSALGAALSMVSVAKVLYGKGAGSAQESLVPRPGAC